MREVEMQTIVDLSLEQFQKAIETGEVITREGDTIRPCKMVYSPRYDEAIATYIIEIIK